MKNYCALFVWVLLSQISTSLYCQEGYVPLQIERWHPPISDPDFDFIDYAQMMDSQLTKLMVQNQQFEIDDYEDNVQQYLRWRELWRNRLSVDVNTGKRNFSKVIENFPKVSTHYGESGTTSGAIVSSPKTRPIKIRVI